MKSEKEMNETEDKFNASESVESDDSLILDPDFTEEEHAEFEQLEKENPYREVEEEKIRVPKRPDGVTANENNWLFPALFCIAMAIFLLIVIFTSF